MSDDWLMAEIKRRMKTGEPFELSVSVAWDCADYTNIAAKHGYKFVQAKSYQDDVTKQWFPIHHTFNPLMQYHHDIHLDKAIDDAMEAK